MAAGPALVFPFQTNFYKVGMGSPIRVHCLIVEIEHSNCTPAQAHIYIMYISVCIFSEDNGSLFFFFFCVVFL
jgi:hypothetical protein